jgi:hypothetical protein
VSKNIYFSNSDMLAEVHIKKNCLDELMNDYLLTLENRFDSSWKVIERVLAMKNNRLIIDGHKLVHQLPSEFIDSYQTAHSVKFLLFILNTTYDPL